MRRNDLCPALINLQNHRLDHNLQTQIDKFLFYFENHCCIIIVAVLVRFFHEPPHENRMNWRHARDLLKATQGISKSHPPDVWISKVIQG